MITYYQYGFRTGDDVVPALNTAARLNKEIKLKPTFFVPLAPKPELSNLLIKPPFAALYRPDTKDALTTFRGMQKRLIKTMPPVDAACLYRLAFFVQQFLRNNFPRLSADQLMDWESWIASRAYPSWRKEELGEIFESTPYKHWEERYKLIKAFVKEEFYLKETQPFSRGIYNRSDISKNIIGPLIASIEEIVYKHPAFIKKIPLPDRPNYISERFAGFARVAETDYSSFEQSFKKQYMQLIEIQMYYYFLRDVSPFGCLVLWDVCVGENFIKFRDMNIKVVAGRMSGEMFTSLGNGFANLIITSFLCEELGLGKPVMVVEGDDAITATASGVFPGPEDYAKLGFEIKMEVVDHFSMASFCGMKFDLEARDVIGNIFKQYYSFLWIDRPYVYSSKKTKMMLLRAKAYSLYYQYKNCPILGALGFRMLYLTRSYSVDRYLNNRSLDSRKRELLLEAIEKVDVFQPPRVHTGSRLVVEREYSILFEEQIRIEKMLETLTFNDQLPTIISDHPLQAACERVYFHYVRTSSDDAVALNFDIIRNLLTWQNPKPLI